MSLGRNTMLVHMGFVVLCAASLASWTNASPSPSRPIYPVRRQQSSSTSTTTSITFGASASTSESGSGGDATAGALSVTIIIPIAVVFGLLILLSIGWGCRKRLMDRIRNNSTPITGNITAEELSSGRRSRSASTAALTGTSTGSSAATASRGGTSGAGGRAARRNVRRTESGRSIRTLPEYSKEAGDEELVLVRQRSASSIEEEDEDGDVLEQVSSPVNNDTDPLQRSATHRSTRSNRSSRSAASPAGAADVAGTQEVAIYGSVPVPNGTRSAPLTESNETPRRSQSSASRISRISRRGWGEAPTYLEAMSSPSFLDSSRPSLEAGVPPPRTPTFRDRTSTSFRGFLNKAGAGMSSFRMPSQQREMSNLPSNRHSSTSLLLQPQTSRLSTMTSESREGSSSPYLSPWASTHSLLHISSPVPNTAVRASFDSTSLPRAGLSNDQMKFLSSSDAVNLVGVKLGDVPANKRRRRSEATSTGGDSPGRGSGSNELPPPSWEDSQAESEATANSAGPSGSGTNEGTPSTVAGINVQPGEGETGREEEGSLEQEHPIAATAPILIVPTQPPPTAATDATGASDATSAPSVEIEPPTPTIASHTPVSSTLHHTPTTASAAAK